MCSSVCFVKLGSEQSRSFLKIFLIESLWNKNYEKAFAQIKNILLRTVMLAHPENTKILRLFTNASEAHWAAVLTRMPQADRSG